MKTFYREDESMIKEVPNAGKLAEGTDYQIIRLILKPGEAQVLHRNQRRVIFYVINGKGVLQVDGRNFQIGNGRRSRSNDLRTACLEKYWGRRPGITCI